MSRNYGVTRRKVRRGPDTFENPVRKSEDRTDVPGVVLSTRQFDFIEGLEDARPQGERSQR